MDNLKLNSKAVSALPIINKFIDRIGLKKLLYSYLPSKQNQKLPHAEVVLIFVRNILLEREPLYKLSEWASTFDPYLVGLKKASPLVLNDDRVGRSLDALFDADRASLLTNIVLKVIEEFSIDLCQLHNDSTTVTVYGEYKSNNSTRNGKTSISLLQGHNKDYRPDLKQLLFTLTVSRDGAVPIHYKSYDGNVTDDRTHIQTWEALRRITARSDFIYVSDCKLCTREQMSYIAKEGGRFISVLPETRKECEQFKTYIRSNNVRWQELCRIPNARSFYADEHVYWGYECPISSVEGYRIIWILDSYKQQQDAGSRQSGIERTIKALDAIKGKVGTGRTKSKKQIEKAVEDVLNQYQSVHFFETKMVLEEDYSYRQTKRGRPGTDTQYLKTVEKKWSFEAMPNDTKIQEAAASDGMFPLITNMEANVLSTKDVLEKYKFQPYIEKRHQQFKSVFEAAPVYLKLPHRIEALMFVYFMVLTLNALIERDLRLVMEKRDIKSLPLYPEERKCMHPTTERIIDLFSNLRKHKLLDGGKEIKCFYDPISALQEEILDLFAVSKDNYTG
jgi:transposase